MISRVKVESDLAKCKGTIMVHVIMLSDFAHAPRILDDHKVKWH